jgi:hypothetical protein
LTYVGFLRFKLVVMSGAPGTTRPYKKKGKKKKKIGLGHRHMIKNMHAWDWINFSQDPHLLVPPLMTMLL